ncbi:hypothetical protein YC2023_086601 [Brassica napus]
MEGTLSPSLQLFKPPSLLLLTIYVSFSTFLFDKPKPKQRQKGVLPTWPTQRDCLALCGGTFSGDLPAASPPFAHQSNKPLERTLPPLKSKLSSEVTWYKQTHIFLVISEPCFFFKVDHCKYCREGERLERSRVW